MNISGVLGLLIGLVAILASQVLETGSLRTMIQPSAGLIVVGCTIGAVFLNFSIPTVINAVKSAKYAFIDDQEDTVIIARQIIQLAHIARHENLLAMQNLLDDIKDPFLRRGVMLAVDISSPQLLQEILSTEISLDEEQEFINARVFEALGGYAPTFGIVGAVIGLIHAMAHLQNPTALGNGVATAFVATLYGVGLANMLFLPIAGKLKMKLREKILLKEMIVHGLISIQMAENPAIIEEKLITFLNFSNRQNNLNSHANTTSY